MAEYYFVPTYNVSSVKEMKEQYVSPNTTTLFVNTGKNQIYTKYLENGQQICRFYQEIPEPKEVTVEDLMCKLEERDVLIQELNKRLLQVEGGKSNANEQSNVGSNVRANEITRQTNDNGFDELK